MQTSSGIPAIFQEERKRKLVLRKTKRVPTTWGETKQTHTFDLDAYCASMVVRAVIQREIL